MSLIPGIGHAAVVSEAGRAARRIVHEESQRRPRTGARAQPGAQAVIDALILPPRSAGNNQLSSCGAAGVSARLVCRRGACRWLGTNPVRGSGISTLAVPKRIDRCRLTCHLEVAHLRAADEPRNHHRRDEAPVIRTGNLHRSQRSRRAVSSQYVIDGKEWR